MFKIEAFLLTTVIVISQAVFTISEPEQGLVLEFGKHKRTIREPGLYVKVPFIQDVVRLDKRILLAESDAKEYLTLDKKRLIVDMVSRWKISDPLEFYKALRDPTSAVVRVNDTISTRLRQHIANNQFGDFIKESKEPSRPASVLPAGRGSAKPETAAKAGPAKPAPPAEPLSQREKIMETVTKEAAEQCREFGISVIDVRIKRVDLPDEVQKSVYERMKAERQRQAKLYRAEGEEISRTIKGKADKTRDVILAKAYASAQELKGQGDARATTIYAEAYGKDPEFYSFVRHLEVYERTLQAGTTILLRPDTDLLKFLSSPGIRSGNAMKTPPHPTNPPAPVEAAPAK